MPNQVILSYLNKGIMQKLMNVLHILLACLSWIIASETLCLVGTQQSYMDSEIRAIMAQYMPLDSSNDVNHHLNEEA